MPQEEHKKSKTVLMRQLQPAYSGILILQDFGVAQLLRKGNHNPDLLKPQRQPTAATVPRRSDRSMQRLRIDDSSSWHDIHMAVASLKSASTNRHVPDTNFSLHAVPAIS